MTKCVVCGACVSSGDPIHGSCAVEERPKLLEKIRLTDLQVESARPLIEACEAYGKDWTIQNWYRMVDEIKKRVGFIEGVTKMGVGPYAEKRLGDSSGAVASSAPPGAVAPGGKPPFKRTESCNVWSADCGDGLCDHK